MTTPTRTTNPTNPTKTTRTTLTVNGMTCNHCAMSVTQALRSLDGVTAVAVDLQSRRAVVEHAEGSPDLTRMKAAVEAIGFEAG